MLIFTLTVSGGALSRAVQQNLARVDLWKGPYGHVKELLRSGYAVCERWIQVCETLSVRFWKRYSPHPWKGGKVVPNTVLLLCKRIDEVSFVMFLTN